VWAGLVFAFLELTSWPYPDDYWSTVPRYLWQVAAPNSQPWPLVGLGLGFLCWRAPRGEAARLAALAVLLSLPFALWAAHRNFAYRDLLPLLYLGYAGAGGLVALGLRWAAERAGPLVAVAAAVAGIAALAFLQTQELVDERQSFDRAAVTQANWDNPLVHDVAAWLEANVPPGAALMSSRLYASHLYVLDRGRHPVHQLPTVRVEPRRDATPALAPVTTLFRWEDHRLQPLPADQRWLYVHRYPEKRYYIALSEYDLLRELDRRSIDYLVLTGEDAGFSTFAYLDYVRDHPAFRLLYDAGSSPEDRVYVFRVDRARLQPQPYRTVLNEATLAALTRELDAGSLSEAGALIDPDGVALRPVAEGWSD
jgi:hypothetical protein